MKKTLLEKFFSAPAEMLEKGVEAGKELEAGITNNAPVKAASKYLRNLGPGLTTGAADDDPSGIATYSQMGASQGFGLIWLSLFSFPLLAVVQEMCARIGISTGVGLAANIRKYYSKKILYLCTFLLLVANVFNIGANLGAMAQGAKLIYPAFNFTFLVFAFAFLSLFLQVFIPYKKYARYLKYLTFVLFAYIISAFSVGIEWREVLSHTFIPSFTFSKEIIILICAGIGTTVSPYLFFWQSSQEVEEQILRGERTVAERVSGTTDEDIKNMRVDVISGMFVSNLVMFFIIAACAATLFANGVTNIATAADAAVALRPFAGNFAFFLFAVGILGTGFLAIPILAGSASYAISESLGWKTGLYRKLKQATSFYGVIIIAMLLGVILNFVGLDPIKALIYSAVLNGIISPFMIFFIVHLSGDEGIMGKFKNSGWGNALGWGTFLIVALVSLGTMVSIIM